ncbi:hypothetical protein B0H11DRAFT_2032379 [Mycena galericulata]|nr:hypothetical protein B0H11DRAFT_2032379 [Mycena galericulata]
MATSIVGTLPVSQSVDSNGSLSLEIPVQTPPAKMAPKLSLAYHSASTRTSIVGMGWALKGTPTIERVAATKDQDGFRGVVNYDENDRFSLDGQRLIRISGNEYRYEIEQWSKITAHGDPTNPTSWTEYLPDGGIRTFGDTEESASQPATRVWAISQQSDAFSNYMTFKYSDGGQGSFYLTEISYGGNRKLTMTHQRQLVLEYELRPDVSARYLGGSIIRVDKRLRSISASVHAKLIHRHVIEYDTAPLTRVSRAVKLTLVDASGATVRPLIFDWVNGDQAMFKPPEATSALDFSGAEPSMLAVDVHATGRSDIVIASKITTSNLPHTRIATHLSDASGAISQVASSVNADLPYHTALFPLDVSGDGRNDLVHISLAGSTFTITVLLSTPDGFRAQASSKFEPRSTAGFFRCGDFEGNGRVGLLYIYPAASDIKFVQFVSDGKNFTTKEPASGPTNVTFSDLKVVVADLNGNGEEDVFLLSPKTKNGQKYCHISLLRSINGILEYQSDDALVRAGESVTWTDTTTFLPYSVDDDGKTSLLVASKRAQTGLLVLQMLRNDGRTLLPSSSVTDTNIRYDGNLTTAHTSTTSTVDLINTFHMGSASPPRTAIHVLRFHDGDWDALEEVRQGPSLDSVTYGDYRGIGRSDLFFNTAVSQKFNTSLMRCASSQPVDFLCGYTNGMNARTDVTYAPLSDGTTYSADSGVSNAPLAASNAMARNVSFSANLSTSKVSESNHSRSEIVYFPAWVVKEVVSTPYSAKPTVHEQTNYAYRNARFSFGGRGWLGFETITKSARVLGTSEMTWYLQEFPFLGQVDRTEIKSTAGQLLQSRKYVWDDVSGGANHSHSIRMSSLSQSYREGAAHAYTVNATYSYDSFGNITELSIVSPEIDTPALSIISSFDNSTNDAWVIGNKTRETVKQAGAIIKDIQISYLPGTPAAKETKNWVKGSEWSTQTIEFDAAGNETVIHGPARAHHELEYDPTYSNIVSSKVFAAENSAPLTETTEISLEHGKPLLFTDANGNTVSLTYDVLGRLRDTFQENAGAEKTLVKTEAFQFESDQFKHVTKSRTTWREDSWSTTVEYVDGQGQTWRAVRSRPDNSSVLIYTDTEYDGAGRTVRSSRDYISGSAPAFTTYKYDARSRVIEETVPPSTPELPITTIASQYKFVSGLEECTETTSAGSRTKILSRRTKYLPNADKPSVDNLAKPFVVASLNELGENVETSFDGLGRPTCVKDPGGVRLSLSWDGLSRLVERRLSEASGKDMSHSSLVYDDDNCTATVRNVFTGTSTTTTNDFCKRPISVTSPDEKQLSFTYDVGGQFSRGHLMSVVSESTGLAHRYDYDIHGNLVLDELTIDGERYSTSYDWSPLGQLTSITNPDGSTITRSFTADGESVSHIVLANAEETVEATISLSRYEDVFGRPLLCEFGNGISSLSAIHNNGALSNMTLSKGGKTLHRQDWKIDGFNRIHDYKRDREGDVSGSRAFLYDASGQLAQSKNSDPNARGDPSADYAYDPCGNLTGKDGQTFVNSGWQLSKITNRDGSTQCSFKYSADGSMLEKLDASGKVTRSMEYDSQGRLIGLDGMRMAYDFGGRLIKCTRANGDVTIYPTQTYEVDIAASGPTTHTSYLVHGYRRASLSGSVVQYYHQDHLGSTIAVSDAHGDIVTQYKYDAFGTVSIEGEDLARYKFSGKELFGDIYHFGARFYDSSIGRFLTLDNYPVELDDISPSTFNMYTFSRNNPVNFIDLNGNAPWWHWLVDAALVAVGVALLFVPVAGPLLMGAVTGALIGAGIAGAVADIQGASDAEWGIQLGLGAVFGAIGGAAAAGVDIALPAVSLSTKAIGSTVSRTAIRFATKFAIEKGVGVVQQLVDNAIHGRAAEAALLPASFEFVATGKIDWQATAFSVGSMAAGYAADKFNAPKTGSSESKRSSKSSVKAAKQSSRPKVETGLFNRKMHNPLNQTRLDVSNFIAQDASNVRFLGMTKTAAL